MHLTSHITHSNVYTPYIAYHRSNGFHQLFRKLKPKPKLNPHNAHRSQIKICVSNVPNMPNVPNAFRILKPIQKSSKRVWVFRNTGANAFAKNQMRLAYEDKRDLYCNRFFNKWRQEFFFENIQRHPPPPGYHVHYIGITFIYLTSPFFYHIFLETSHIPFHVNIRLALNIEQTSVLCDIHGPPPRTTKPRSSTYSAGHPRGSAPISGPDLGAHLWRHTSPHELTLTTHLGGRRNPAVACWASDHWVASSNLLRGKFRH